jgi:hypothetical protein
MRRSKTPYIATRLLTFIEHAHRGRENTITHADLLREMQLFDITLDDRVLRKLCSELPLCSCDAGVFFPLRVEEVIEFKEYLTKNGGPIVAARRVAIIYERMPKLRPLADVQRNIDFSPTQSVFKEDRRRTIFED